MQEEARADISAQEAQRAAIVLYQPRWHEGVIGLLASRIKEEHWRPTIVFCDAQEEGLLKGSGRSIKGLHLRDALDETDRLCPGAIVRFGGHAMAAGLTLRKERLAAFRQAFLQACQRHLSPQDLQRVLLLDEPPPLDQQALDAARALEQGVWGQAFDEPLFGSTLPIVRQTVLKDAHLRLEIEGQAGQRIKGICFGRTEPIGTDELLAWRLEVDRWGGSEQPAVRVEASVDAPAA